MNRRACRLSGSVRLGLCVLSMLVLCAQPRPIQAQQVSLSFAQGTHLFRRILYDLGLHPLRSRDQLAAQPEKTLLILLGETDYLKASELEAFVRRGGAVLLATDRDCQTILQPFRVEIVGSPVKVNADTRYAYKKSSDCIFIQPGGQDFSLFENLSLENNLSRVATNRPGFVVPAPGCPLKVQAVFPLRSWAMHEQSTHYGLTFAVGGSFGRGRLLILSDHSVLINAMMWQQDIENFDFAYNCVNWLTEGKRTEVLFLEEGEIRATFEVPLKDLPPPPLPPLKAIVETVDKTLGELERENVFNRAIHNAVTDATSPPEKWLRVLILISTGVLAMVAFARLSQARHRLEKAAPLAVSALAQAAPATLFEQRHRSMEQDRNFWEAARALARQGIESALGVPFQAQQQASEVAVAELPALQGSWWRKWRLRRRFNRLWQLAYGTEPVRISPQQLKRLRSQIEGMKTGLARNGE
jgi:hypothetical protein